MLDRDPYRQPRREFLIQMAASGAVAITGTSLTHTLFAQEPEPATQSKAIAEVFLDIDKIHKWDASNGDTWDPFWADDGNLYAFNCDGRGFGQKSMNMAFNRLAGKSPDSLAGAQINPMDEYGKGGQKGPDNATWKACGQECIDGVFYAFVSRNTYGSDSKDPLVRQLAVNSSLIKSTDRGLTWTRSASENYDHPMWPGARFGAPFFIHYGRNGGQVTRDGASGYVYAVSTNGFWNDGDSLILGRVKRRQLSRLDSADWEYFTGQDGSRPENWSSVIERATPILDRPAKCGQTPICYVPELGIYLLISWYNTAILPRWFEPNEMRYDFYQAPHPWGPWRPLNSVSDRFMGPGYHFYGPSLCARFQQRQRSDVAISLFTSGCPFNDAHGSPYKMWHIPVLLRSAPLPASQLLAAADKQIAFHGSWFAWSTVEDASANNLPRATQTAGDTAELAFTGTGIEYLAHKTRGLGTAEIYLDGVRQPGANLNLEDFPVFFNVAVFSKQGLPPGKHVIRIVNPSNARINLAAFKVYS